MVFPILLLAVSLSLDALGVGLAYGLRKIKIPLGSKLIICFFSLFYSGGALLLGKTLAKLIDPEWSGWIGSAILIMMGFWIIVQVLFKKENKPEEVSKPDEVIPATNEERTLLKIAIKSLGITIHVIRNPIELDMDYSGSIDSRESFLLGLALSIDAIGAGIGSGMIGFESWVIPVLVGIFQLSFLYLGCWVGERTNVAVKINQQFLALSPGFLLILMAIIRMVHLPK